MASCEPLSWQEQEENQFYWYACVETGAPVETILITSPFVVALLLQYVVDFLATKAKMLQEYFSLEIKVSFISREHHYLLLLLRMAASTHCQHC